MAAENKQPWEALESVFTGLHTRRCCHGDYRFFSFQSSND